MTDMTAQTKYEVTLEWYYLPVRPEHSGAVWVASDLGRGGLLVVPGHWMDGIHRFVMGGYEVDPFGPDSLIYAWAWRAAPNSPPLKEVE